jgi:heterodisulfide reductase subunit C
MTDLQKLALESIMQLGQEALNIHEDLERWREKPLTSVERTEESVKLKRKLEKQREWIQAIFDDEE